MSNWANQFLGNVADVKLSNVDKKKKDGEIEVKLCNYTDVYKNTFINLDKAKGFMVASCTENEYHKFKLRKGQVAITKDSEKRNDIGISTYIAEDFEDVVLGYHLSLITPLEEKLDGCFLNYWFSTCQAKKYFENNTGGSGQRFTLPLDIIKGVPINLPDLPTQQKIASVLSALDDKIELNNKINAELEAMAKTLYDYWFVQFEFPNADGKPYKSSGGKMVYNETLKREIPEGWEVKRFGDLFEISRGNIITKETSTVGEYKVVAAGLNFSYYHNEYNREKFTITVSGSGANAGFVNFWTERIYASDCTTVRGSNNYKTFIALQFLRLYQDYIFSLAKGSAQPHVYPSDIEGLNFICIPDELINEYGRISSNIYEKISNNQQQNQELAALRDWLLPMLMNGQVKVEDVEKEEVNKAAEASIKFKHTRHNHSDDAKFEHWLQHQGLAARGDIDTDTLREIFDAMDDEDK